MNSKRLVGLDETQSHLDEQTLLADSRCGSATDDSSLFLHADDLYTQLAQLSGYRVP